MRDDNEQLHRQLNDLKKLSREAEIEIAKVGAVQVHSIAESALGFST
jgi:hypothetical protein